MLLRDFAVSLRSLASHDQLDVTIVEALALPVRRVSRPNRGQAEHKKQKTEYANTYLNFSAQFNFLIKLPIFGYIWMEVGKAFLCK